MALGAELPMMRLLALLTDCSIGRYSAELQHRAACSADWQFMGLLSIGFGDPRLWEPALIVVKGVLIKSPASRFIALQDQVWALHNTLVCLYLFPVSLYRTVDLSWGCFK